MEEIKKITIGQKVKNIRKERKIKQYELAAKSDYTATALSLLENDVNEPFLGTIRRVAEALDMEMSELLEGVK